MFLLILVLLKESAGDTFFYYYGEGTHTLTCNRQADKNRTVWYEGKESLLTFELMNCNGKSKPLQPCAKEPEDTASLCTERNVSITAFSIGGVFACKSLMANEKDYECPLFNNLNHCNTYDFFIIAIIDNMAEQGISEERNKTLKLLTVEENKNFTLSCEFDMPGKTFALYWIKDADPSTCIFSVTNYVHDLSYDLNCCINTTVKQRRDHNSTDSQQLHQRHDITIINATQSDSGRYLCVFSVWDKKHKWEIISNVTVEVQLSDPLDVWKTELLISMGVIGSILLIGGMACFLFQIKKCKGKPSELHLERIQTTVELQEDECSPYAVGSRNDTERNDCVYSLAGSPGVPLNGASSLSYGKAASKMQPGESVQAIYARVNKQR